MKTIGNRGDNAIIECRHEKYKRKHSTYHRSTGYSRRLQNPLLLQNDQRRW